MSFVFPFALGGLVLVGVPILLHLIMRQKPKQLPFPAFRFLLQKHRTNLRKLRLRHLLLLALRVLLIAAVVLALARPKALTYDGPIAAVFLFDTSPSMDYKVEDRSRLEEAKRRAHELLREMPDDSRVLVLDTARGNRSWLSPKKAGPRIDELKVRPDNFSVTHRLGDAYDLLQELARDRDEDKKALPRFLYVFSDGTPACWDAALVKRRQEEVDRILPPAERLARMTDRVGPLLDTLRAQGDKLGLKDAPNALAASLKELRDYIPTAGGADYPDTAGDKLIPVVRRQLREMIRQVQALGESLTGANKEVRDKLLGQLQDFLRDLKGVHEVFVNVGAPEPQDLAVVDLELPRQIDRDAPRQVFSAHEEFTLRATVRATGTTYDAPIECLVDGTKVNQKPLKGLKAGGSVVIPFKINCARLSRGLHQVEVKVPALDSLAFDDRRFLTFEIREARKVLVIADDPRQVDAWTAAVGETGEFECKTIPTREVANLGKQDLRKYQAVCLIDVARPDNNLWELLARYVQDGGGLAVIPGGDELDNADGKKAYNEDATAKKLLPGRLLGIIKTAPQPGALLDWQPSSYQHPLLKPFKKWIPNPRVDFVKVQRRADRYWQVEPNKKGADVLIRYEGKAHSPAILESRPGGNTRGKVLLFTTPLDARQGWNNYMEEDSSFCVILPHLTMRYLAGSAAGMVLNFQSGQPVVVPLPLAGRHPPYSVDGPRLEDGDATLEPPASENLLRVKGAVRPGNYPVTDKDRNRIAAFSVNVPPLECDLSRVPPEQIAVLFGPDSLLPLDARANLLEALRSHWSRPRELLPWVLVALLFLLAAEALLANRFYRRAPEAPPAPPKTEGAPP